MSNIDVRVSKLEGVTQKMAGVMKNLQSGQSTIAEVISELTGIVSSEIREQVSQEVISAKEDLKNEVSKDMTTVKSDVEAVKTKLKQTGIDRHKQANIKKKLASRTYQLVGSKNTPSYKLFYSAVRGRLTKLLKNHYNVPSYKDISIEEYEDAINYIDSLFVEDWFIDFILKQWIQKSEDGEIKVSEQRALDIYLDSLK